MRVKSIRLSTPGSRSRSIGATGSSRPSLDTRSRPTVFQIPQDVVTDVERQLDQQTKKRTFDRKVARSTRIAKNSSTVRIANLPLPGKVDISAYIREEPKASSSKIEVDSESEDAIKSHVGDERPKPPTSDNTDSEPTSTKHNEVNQSSTSRSSFFPPALNLQPGTSPNPPTSEPGSSSSAQPPPAFGGIKLSLDPGDLSSTHTRSRAPVSGGSRAHHAAPRLNASPSPSPGGSGQPSISFFPPPSASGGNASATPKDGPKGFFSFSGYGQQ